MTSGKGFAWTKEERGTHPPSYGWCKNWDHPDREGQVWSVGPAAEDIPVWGCKEISKQWLCCWMVSGDWNKKKKRKKAVLRAAWFVKLLKVSTDFCPYFQVHLRGVATLSVPSKSPQFCWLLLTIACQEQHMLWGLSYQCTCPRSNRTKTSRFFSLRSH